MGQHGGHSAAAPGGADCPFPPLSSAGSHFSVFKSSPKQHPAAQETLAQHIKEQVTSQECVQIPGKPPSKIRGCVVLLFVLQTGCFRKKEWIVTWNWAVAHAVPAERGQGFALCADGQILHPASAASGVPQLRPACSTGQTLNSELPGAASAPLCPSVSQAVQNCSAFQVHFTEVLFWFVKHLTHLGLGHFIYEGKAEQ